ncbi:hypothetical protein ES705_19264 [subsurface metagenome]
MRNIDINYPDMGGRRRTKKLYFSWWGMYENIHFLVSELEVHLLGIKMNRKTFIYGIYTDIKTKE